MDIDGIETKARELYELIETALPEGLNVEGGFNEADDTDIDHCKPELDRAFDLIDEVIEALRKHKAEPVLDPHRVPILIEQHKERTLRGGA